ncbi:MAG: c-type cytochrome [Deltaproteobacteria bacterium]|nr:c-type cytochrome [Deltaproteobacteria bacterium]MBI3077530.1 c-type cytochrome [Deltaproteobacteria bacterium]
MRGRWWVAGGLGLLVAVNGCATVRDGGRHTAVVAGEVVDAQGRPITTGLVLLERGKLYDDLFERGGLIDSRGRFAIAVQGGGPWGLHVYSEGYMYHPRQIQVAEGQVNEYRVVLPPDPNLRDNPIIGRVAFEPQPDGTVLVKMDVTDPDNNLGPQVLALNGVTGENFVMQPPVPMRDPKANFPQGTYTLHYRPRGVPLDTKSWFFVVADHQCNVSQIAAYPFTARAPRAAVTPPPPPAELARLTPVERGRRTFEARCALCHNPDSKEEKIGPGLQGVFKERQLPASGRPVSPEAITRQIQQGGDRMPPLSDITEQTLQDLLAYLRTL